MNVIYFYGTESIGKRFLAEKLSMLQLEGIQTRTVVDPFQAVAFVGTQEIRLHSVVDPCEFDFDEGAALNCAVLKLAQKHLAWFSDHVPDRLKTRIETEAACYG